MAISLSSVINAGATASIMHNPVSTALSKISNVTSGIGDLSSGVVGQIGGALSGVTSMSGKVAEYMDEEMERLKVKLPIMAAVSSLEKKASSLAGKLPGTNASSLLETATQGITQLGGMMNSVEAQISSSIASISAILPDVAGATPQQKLRNFALSAPPMKISDPADPSGETMIPNPAYTAFAAANAQKISGLDQVGSGLSGTCASAMSFLDSIKSAEGAAVKAGAGKLKDFAFAKFAASPQPVAVQNVLDKFVSKPDAGTYVDLRVIGAASTTQNVVTKNVDAREYTQLPPAKSADATTTPVVSTGDTSNLTPSNAASYRQTLEQAAQQLFDWKKRVDEKIAPVEQWKRARNYDQVKSDALANPNDQTKKAAFAALKAELIETPEYKQYDADATAYNKARARALIDIERYNSAVNGISGNFQAGVETFGALALAVLLSR